MLKYAIRRLFHMLPIVFGVILLTFILFNVVGGSQAGVALGKHASVAELEDYDERHGFNKPLLFGRWVRTRAYEDFEPQTPVVLKSGQTYDLGKTFHQVTYRWQILCRGVSGTKAILSGTNNQQSLDVIDSWQTLKLDVPSDSFSLKVTQGQLELAGVSLRRKMNNPFDSQFIFYLRRLLHLDFGVSSQTNQKVLDVLKAGVWQSLSLTIPIFIGGLLTALVLALICAWYRNSWLDRALVVLATALMSVNYVIWVVAGQFVFAYKLRWFPIWGYESWRFLLLPVLIGIFTGLGRDTRFYRTLMLDEMYQDYVRTARAKGLKPGKIMFRHVLRNALVPVITNVSMSIPFLFMGSLLLESFFGIPGLGGLSINAINSADMNVIRAVVLIGAILYAFINLLTDLCYAWVDPRVRLK